MDPKEKLRAIINQLDMLSQVEKDLIVQEVAVEVFKKGTVLLQQGQLPKTCYLVLEGCIREYSIINERERTTAFYTEGDGTQYIGRGKDQPSEFYLECVEDCTLMLGTESMEDHIRKLVPRLDAMIQEVSKQKLEQVKSEMATFMYASPEDRYKQVMNTRPFLFNRVPHYQIASYLGMEPQSLSRIRKRIFDQDAGGKD